MSKSKLTVADYLNDLTAPRRKQYNRVRKLVIKIAGADAITQSISYGIIAFLYHGKPLIYFGSFKKHMSLFPPTTKFTEEEPLTDKQITTMIKSLLPK